MKTMDRSHVSAVEQTICYMKGHLDEPITTEQLASLAGYSTFHFTRIFKRVTGVSPRLYLSALRIESSKKQLLEHRSALVRMLLSLGFRSVGTFTARFTQFVGTSPRKFRNGADRLAAFLNAFQHEPLLLSPPEHGPGQRIVCEIDAPATFNGIIFVGLFPRPIPDQKPIAGTALSKANRICMFTGVPAGTYYVLAAGIPWSLNPATYFLLDKCLRAKHEAPIDVTDTSSLHVKLQLRGPQPTDPPILVNLPLLLFEQTRR